MCVCVCVPCMCVCVCMLHCVCVSAADGVVGEGEGSTVKFLLPPIGSAHTGTPAVSPVSRPMPAPVRQLSAYTLQPPPSPTPSGELAKLSKKLTIFMDD